MRVVGIGFFFFFFFFRFWFLDLELVSFSFFFLPFSLFLSFFYFLSFPPDVQAGTGGIDVLGVKQKVANGSLRPRMPDYFGERLTEVAASTSSPSSPSSSSSILFCCFSPRFVSPLTPSDLQLLENAWRFSPSERLNAHSFQKSLRTIIAKHDRAILMHQTPTPRHVPKTSSLSSHYLSGSPLSPYASATDQPPSPFPANPLGQPRTIPLSPMSVPYSPPPRGLVGLASYHRINNEPTTPSPFTALTPPKQPSSPLSGFASPTIMNFIDCSASLSTITSTTTNSAGGLTIFKRSDGSSGSTSKALSLSISPQHSSFTPFRLSDPPISMGVQTTGSSSRLTSTVIASSTTSLMLKTENSELLAARSSSGSGSTSSDSQATTQSYSATQSIASSQSKGPKTRPALAQTMADGAMSLGMLCRRCCCCLFVCLFFLMLVFVFVVFKYLICI
jgi:hypothetical protein